MGAFPKCRICTSPHRHEIDSLVKDTPISDVCRQYAVVYGCTERQLQGSIRNHMRGRHKLPKQEVIMHPSQVSEGPVNLDTFAQSLLDIAGKQIAMDPSKVKIRDALAAQKLLIERQKVKIGETALMMSMAKLFGGFKEIQGEELPVLDGTVRPDTN